MSQDLEDFPFIQKITKESFSLNIDQLINDQLQDSFDPDEFLYKQFRFISLNDLIRELTQLNKSLDDDLFKLINDDYNDFIELGQNINDNNFITLLSNIKYIVNNYKTTLDSQQQVIETNFETINEKIYFKKKVFLLSRFLEKLILLNKLIDSFETKIAGHFSKKPQPTDDFLLLIAQEGENSQDLSILDIKELTNMYLSIHQLQTALQGDNQQRDNKLEDLLEVPHNIFSANDINNNIKKLNNLDISNLLQPLQTQSSSHLDVYHHPQESHSNQLMSTQHRRINKLKLEFQSILDEYIEKSKDNKQDLDELMGIYLIIGEEKRFLDRLVAHK